MTPPTLTTKQREAVAVELERLEWPSVAADVREGVPLVTVAARLPSVMDDGADDDDLGVAALDVLEQATSDERNNVERFDYLGVDPEQDVQRARHDAGACPNCAAISLHDTGWRSTEHGDDCAWQDCICPQCGAGFREVYSITSTMALDCDREEGYQLSPDDVAPLPLALALRVCVLALRYEDPADRAEVLRAALQVGDMALGDARELLRDHGIDA